MKTARKISAIGLCTAALAAMLLIPIRSQAGEVMDAIVAGTLTDTDAVAYMIYGLEHRGRPPRLAGTVARGGTRGGFEIKYDHAERVERVFEKISNCKYQVTSRIYPYTALLGEQPTPTIVKFDVDFTKVTRATIVREDKWTATVDLFGLTCTPHDNGERTCDALGKGGLYTAADGPTLVKTLEYFRKQHCAVRP